MDNKKTRPVDSKMVAAAALRMALTETREEENELKEALKAENIFAAAVNHGGDAIGSVTKIIERTVVAAKREHVITDTHSEEGAVAGATHEALTQILPKAMGLNMGGKIGVARYKDHMSVAIVMSVGLLHLNEVAVGLAHRAIG